MTPCARVGASGCSDASVRAPQGYILPQTGHIEMLAVSGVHLPPHLMEKRDSVTFFAVEVASESGLCWRVMRRYNDFNDLNEQLGGYARFPGAKFPRKHICCEGAKLERRRLALELWLRRAVEHPRSSAEWLGPLRRFLECGRKFLVEAEAAPQPAQDDMLLEVVVPSGVSEGQLLAVAVPDGSHMTITVPKGLEAGSKLELSYSPSTKMLTPARK